MKCLVFSNRNFCQREMQAGSGSKIVFKLLYLSNFRIPDFNMGNNFLSCRRELISLISFKIVLRVFIFS